MKDLPESRRKAQQRDRVGLLALLAIAFCAATGAEEAGGPLSLEVVYTGEVLDNLAGGLRKGSAYLDNLDLMLDVDTEALWGLGGSELFVYGLYNNGTSFSETVVGDFQVLSNIETGVRALRLYEAWFRFRLGARSELLVGLYDLNSEFDVLESSRLFIGSAHGIGTDISQAGLNGPSIFPVTGLAVRVARRLNEQWLVRAAVLDGVPGDPEDPDATAIRLSADEGALVIGELERRTDTSRVLIGAWGYTAKFVENPIFPEFESPAGKRGNSGAYLRGEKTVLDGDPALSLFGRVGYAHGDFNVFDYFASAGVSGRGLIPGRPADEAGFAIAWSETSAAVKDAAAIVNRAIEPREIAVELTYRITASERFAIQPHVQYVVNPGLDPEIDNALVAGLRFEIGLTE